MGSGHCGMGNPRGAVFLIAIVDIILSLILLLLSIVALGDLKKVSELLDRESSFSDQDFEPDIRSDWDEVGRHENDNLNGGIFLFLINTLVTLVLAVGLFIGVQKVSEHV
ncbi:unnamed protein product [Allacma fusca]|uniref:Uncharacterized protein n=1 Tax=Allacma fusca TaxID=39272 RepID=A0A8J2JR12_9HEXA|nr:unnamed protein product [Allacma fusca]